MTHDTTRARDEAGPAMTNGHNGHDFGTGGSLYDGAGPDALANYITGAQWADELGEDPESAVAEVLGDDTWKALRKFCRRHDIAVEYADGGMAFADFDAVPRSVWHHIAKPAVSVTRRQAAEFAVDTMTHDANAVGAGMELARQKRSADRRAIGQELQSVSPDAEYSLHELERMCGATTAANFRRAIEQHNRDTWNMGPAAARKYHRDEHTYLVTAAELVRGTNPVPGDLVATMKAATPADRSAAWSDLADARTLHRNGVVAEHDSVSSRWCDLDDLDALPAPGWLVSKLVPAAALTRLVGMSQSLKSFIALDMALSVATGTPFAGLARFGTGERGHVIYVVGEGVHGIDKRVRAWCAHRGVDRAAVSKNLTVLRGAAQLGSRRDTSDVTAKVAETGARLIIFDTQARCTLDLEENSATEQGKAIAALDALMRATGVAVLMLHHTTKSDARNPRGSVAWTGAVDAELVALREREDLAVDLAVIKMKDDDNTGVYPLKALKVALPTGDESLVIAPGADPSSSAFDPDRPMEQWTGKGSAYVKAMYVLAQENCIPGERLTQTRLADIANEVTDTVTVNGKARPKRRVCGKNTAISAVKLLVEHEKLMVAKRDYLGHVFYEPRDYPPSDPTAISSLTGDPAAG